MRENPGTRQEFLEALDRCLRKLPESERADALSYYEEYFEEAGEERLAETLEALGDPRDIAVRILSERTVLQIDAQPPSAKKGFASVWTVILAIFAAPIALPLAIAAAAVLFAVAVVIFSLLFAAAAVIVSLIVAVGAMFVGLVVGGLCHFLIGIVLIPQSAVSALFFLGFGACAMGLGMACLPLLVLFGRKGFAVCRDLFAHRFPRWVKRLVPKWKRGKNA